MPAILILALIGWWIYSAALERRWTDYAHRLESEPGIVITHAEKRGSRFYISGLRDPMAADPAALLPANLPSAQADFHWEPYDSVAPQFALPREFASLKRELERRAFRFMTGSAEIPPEQNFLLEDVGAQILSLIQAGAALGQSVRIEVRGNHDPAGTEEFNAMLSRARAENVRSALIKLSVPADRLMALPEDRARETCSAVEEQERMFCRSASLRVIEAP